MDGFETKIINSGGMMALKIPAGEHQIVFTYHTPGFRVGSLVSATSVCIFMGFVFISKRKKRG